METMENNNIVKEKFLDVEKQMEYSFGYLKSIIFINF